MISTEVVGVENGKENETEITPEVEEELEEQVKAEPEEEDEMVNKLETRREKMKTKNKFQEMLQLDDTEVDQIFRKNKAVILAEEDRHVIECSKIKIIKDDINKKTWLRFVMDRYYIYDKNNKVFVDPFLGNKEFESQKFAEFIIDDVLTSQDMFGSQDINKH